MRSLGEIKDSRAVEPLVTLLINEDLALQIIIIESLEKIDPKWKENNVVKNFIAQLINNLKDNNPDIRNKAILLIGKIKDINAVDPLIDILLDNDYETRKIIIEALNQIDLNWQKNEHVKKLIDRFISELGNSDLHYRTIKIEALKDIAPEYEKSELVNKIVDHFINNLNVKDYNIKRQAIMVLGELKHPRAIEVLITSSFIKIDEIDKEETIRALDNIDMNWRKSNAAIDAVSYSIKILKEDNFVEAQAKTMFGEINDPQKMIVFIKIRCNAVIVLGEIKNSQTIEPMIPLLLDEDPYFRGTVIRALDNIDTNWRKNNVAVKLISDLNKDLKNKNLTKRENALLKLKEINNIDILMMYYDKGMKCSTTRFSAYQDETLSKKNKIRVYDDDYNDRRYELTIKYLNDKLNLNIKDEYTAACNLPDDQLKDTKILIIPTRALDYFTYMRQKIADEVFIFTDKFSRYLADGGNIFCFSQVYGKDYEILPVPTGDRLVVKGYKESDTERIALLDEYHPILSGIEDINKLTISMDGYFQEWPKNSNKILIRNTQQLPGYIIYQYESGGYIALTNMYSDDPSYIRHPEIEDKIVRDTISWLRNPNLLTNIVRPEAGENKIALPPIKIENYSQDTTFYAWIYIYSPKREVMEDKIWKVEIKPKEIKEANIEINIKADSELGIWGIGYKLSNDSTFISPLAEESWVQGFTVRKKLKLWELNDMKNNHNIESLILSLKDNDNDPFIIERTVKFLKEIDSTWQTGESGNKAILNLIDALSHNNPEIQSHAALSLGEIKDTRAVQSLITALKDKNPSIRVNSARALGKIKDPRAVEPLIDALKDDDVNVNGNVIWALGEINDERTAEILKKIKEEDEEDKNMFKGNKNMFRNIRGR
ncbi:MAG: HEAT repeat domain-containing protein [Candidatus Firestonebacteria bacterium]|nr:HEAT repeat domain-containing protein [Candidatus Firestonebacteria bacterium]